MASDFLVDLRYPGRESGLGDLPGRSCSRRVAPVVEARAGEVKGVAEALHAVTVLVAVDELAVRSGPGGGAHPVGGSAAVGSESGASPLTLPDHPHTWPRSVSPACIWLARSEVGKARGSKCDPNRTSWVESSVRRHLRERSGRRMCGEGRHTRVACS